MSQAPFPNSYNLRKVAETSAKSCDVCYKLSTSVLITPDQKDFFYVCLSHLKDRQFCTPLADPSAAAAKRDRQLAEEKERLKKEYEEKQKRKKEKEEKDKEDKEKKEKESSGYVSGSFKAVGSGLKWGAKAIWGESEQPKDGKEGTGEAAASKPGSPAAMTASSDDDPKTFELKPNFYNQRVQRKRQAEAAKRDRERAAQPGYFPDVPTHQPGK